MSQLTVGFLAALLGGMGLGGGGVLLLCLTASGVPQLEAQGINLIFFLPTAAVALCGHAKNGFVRWDLAVKTALFGLPGVLFGSFIAGSIDEHLLKAVFAALLLFVGIKELLPRKTDKK